MLAFKFEHIVKLELQTQKTLSKKAMKQNNRNICQKEEKKKTKEVKMEN